MFGQYGAHHDGWLLSTKVNRAPWQAFGAPIPTAEHPGVPAVRLNREFNQATDIAEKNPQKVKEMREMFMAEARKYQVFRWTPPWRRASSRRAEHHGRSQGVRLHAADGRLPQGDSPDAVERVVHITATSTCPGRRRKA